MIDNTRNQKCIPLGQFNLSNRLRRLWSQLAMWRRDYLVSLAANYGDLQMIEERLYNATKDFRNVFQTFFGIENADRVSYYITVQASILNEIANAMKAGDAKTVDSATKRLYQNVDELSAYLSQINSYWSQDTFKRLFYDYYKQTLLEMVSVLSGNHGEAIQIYEDLEDYVLEIADYMTDGFIPYFTATT